MRLFRDVYSSKNALLALAAAFLISGCGNNLFSSIANKNSAAANSVAAQQALNSGDNATAINMLNPGSSYYDNGNPLTGNLISPLPAMSGAQSQQLAAAYMGAAGLNTVTMAQKAATTASNASSSGASTGTSNFSTISALFPGLSSQNLVNINNAILVLNNPNISSKPDGSSERSLSSCSTGAPAPCMTNDEFLQLGIAEVTASVLAIGLSGNNPGFDANGLPNWCNGDCRKVTAQQLSAFVTTALPAGVTVPGVTNPKLGDYIGYYLVQAALNIVNATGGSSNNVSQVVNSLIYTVKNGATSCSAPSTPPTGTASSITAGQLQTFIQNCLHN